MSKKTPMFVLDNRSKEILLAVVKIHIATGEPVGSRIVAEQSHHNLSPATIRNIMGDLEEIGYLTQPHTSAGRIPTDKGYRVYVDSLIHNWKLSLTDEKKIYKSLLEDNEVTHDNILERASHIVSQLSNNVGIVLSPRLSQDVLQHIEFVRLSEKRILVITVSCTGVVQNRIIRIDEDISQDKLDQIARYIVHNFNNLSLSMVREELIHRMSEEKALYDHLLLNAILLCDKSLQGDTHKADIYVDGAVNILNRPDFSDVERMKDLFKMFEEKQRLVKILNECLFTLTKGKVATYIGTENQLPSMQNCTIITSPYFYDNQVMGSISIVGPTRMEYERMIGIVSCIADFFNNLLENKHLFDKINKVLN